MTQPLLPSLNAALAAVCRGTERSGNLGKMSYAGFDPRIDRSQ